MNETCDKAEEIIIELRAIAKECSPKAMETVDKAIRETQPDFCLACNAYVDLTHEHDHGRKVSI